MQATFFQFPGFCERHKAVCDSGVPKKLTFLDLMDFLRVRATHTTLKKLSGSDLRDMTELQ